MKFIKNKYMIMLFILGGLINLNIVYANNESQNKQVKQDDKQKIKTPDLNLTLKQNLNSEYEALSTKIGDLQEKMEKEKYILSSVNQNIF